MDENTTAVMVAVAASDAAAFFEKRYMRYTISNVTLLNFRQQLRSAIQSALLEFETNQSDYLIKTWYEPNFVQISPDNSVSVRLEYSISTVNNDVILRDFVKVFGRGLLLAYDADKILAD